LLLFFLKNDDNNEFAVAELSENGEGFLVGHKK